MSGHTPRRSTQALVLALLVLAAIQGCSPNRPTFVDTGASYNQKSVLALAASVETTSLAQTSTERATALRHEALTALRSSGERAVPVADLITRTFPADTRGVPVYFERASFDGKLAIIMIEATGPPKGKLSSKRVWVLDENGAVLFFGGR